MKVAHISPWYFIEQTTALSPYKMGLGQILLREEWYRDLFRSYAAEGCFIIVDNGAAEEDTPPFEKIVEVANWVGADEIVLPDKLEDGAYTAAETVIHSSKISPLSRVIIPQGRDSGEWIECFETIQKGLAGEFRTIGIAKHFEGKEGGRPRLIQYLMDNRYHLKYDIHLFGFYADPISEVREALRTYPFIRGCDSGAAAAWAQKGKFFYEHREHLSLNWEDWDFPSPVTNDVGFLNSDQRRIARVNAITLGAEASRWAFTMADPPQ